MNFPLESKLHHGPSRILFQKPRYYYGQPEIIRKGEYICIPVLNIRSGSIHYAARYANITLLDYYRTFQIYKLEEVALHNSAEDIWMAIHNKVYDITKFIDEVNQLLYKLKII